MQIAYIHGCRNRAGDHFMECNRLAAVALHRLTASMIRIAVRHLAVMGRFAVMAAGAMTVVEIVTGTARAGGFVLELLATVLRFRAAAATAHQLEVSEASASDHRSAIEYDQRYGGPYDGRPIVASDKSR